jgi:predicted DNA-binding protein
VTEKPGLYVRLPRDLLRSLRVLAASEARPLAELVRDALSHYLTERGVSYLYIDDEVTP